MTTHNPQPSALALVSVGGCAVGAALLLVTPALRIASAHTPSGQLTLRPGLGGGWGVLACGLAGLLCAGLGLLRREPRWLAVAIVPGLVALGWFVWYLSARLPALADAAGNVSLGPGAWCWLGGSVLLLVGAVTGALLVRSVTRYRA